MELPDKRFKASLMVGLLQAPVIGLALALSIAAYRTWGWNIFITGPLLLLVLMMGVSPLTRRVYAAYSRD